MNSTAPQYHLLAEARPGAKASTWRFVLQATDGSLHLDVTDQEPGAPLERLELLAVVRGLEALDQPSRVTLSTSSRYVNHGLRYGLNEWREAGWQWESFGQMLPIKHEDLWRRIDQALSFHRVQCRMVRVDAAAPSAVPTPAFARRPKTSTPRIILAQRETVETAPSRTPWLALRERVAGMLMGLGHVIAPESISVAVG